MDKRLHYTISDFVQDESFIRWVKKESFSDDPSWEEWIQNHPDKKEELEKATVLIKHLAFKEDSISQDSQNQLWNNISKEIDEKPDNVIQQRPFPIKRLLVGLSAIAAIFLLFILLPGFSNKEFIKTDYAEVETFVLPDQSTVTLNADSDIQFNRKNWDEKRIVQLNGEAFFEVEKGKKFTVSTNLGEVEVLGTSFNVFARDNQFSVICNTGKVLVKTINGNQLLSPNQAFTSDGKATEFIPFQEANVQRSNWKEGIYHYSEENLINVIKEMERQFEIQVKLPTTLNALKFTGSFDTKNKLESLSEVLWPLGLKYEVKGQKVIISEE